MDDIQFFDVDLSPSEIASLAAKPTVHVTMGGVSFENGGHLTFSNTLIFSNSILNLTLSNGGLQPLTLGTPSLSGVHVNQFSIINSPLTSLAPSESTIIGLRFDPTNGGTNFALLSFGNNDFNNSNFTLNLLGPAATISWKQETTTGYPSLGRAGLWLHSFQQSALDQSRD